MTIVAPIHVEAIGIHNVRFFRSPLTGPRQPWHSVDDLHAAMAMPRDLRRTFKKKLSANREWKKSIVTVDTEKGKTTIAPHWMAQGLIGSMTEAGVCPVGFERSYALGMVAAMKVITAGMSPEDGINHSIAAFRNENGIEGDFERIKMIGIGPNGERLYGT